MSWNPLLKSGFPDAVSADAIETLIVPRAVDLGGFEVRRALPAPQRQMVGPFIFFDQAGPGEFVSGQGADVRPHPHIELATVTYLFRGEILHRDSVGSNQLIRPGDVNWMVAGEASRIPSERPPRRAKGPIAATGFRPGSRYRKRTKTRAQLRASRQGQAASP